MKGEDYNWERVAADARMKYIIDKEKHIETAQNCP